MDETIANKVMLKARRGQLVMIGYQLASSLTEEEQVELKALYSKHKKVKLTLEARQFLRAEKER